MPVAFLSDERGGRYVPAASEPFRLGCDPDSELVDPDEGVSATHAALSYVKGEYVLVATDGCPVRVNDHVVPFMMLRDGDEIRLGPAGGRWEFRHRLEGTYRTPDASLAATWMACPAFHEVDHGPARFGDGPGVEGRDPARCRRVPDPAGGGDLVVKRLGLVRDPGEADGFLRVLSAVGGAPHPALASLVDGGLTPAEGGARRWMAARWVPGVTAAQAVARGGVDPLLALGVLRAIAHGLTHLHRRGVVHRDLSPGNVILTPDGGAVLIDFGQAVLASAGAPPSRGVVGTPGFVAPEEVIAGTGIVGPPVDCYGLAAVGYALLTGRPPAEGEDVLERLAGAARPAPAPRDLGVDLPQVLESVLLDALSQDPAERPTAGGLLRAAEFAAAQLGLGGVLS